MKDQILKYLKAKKGYASGQDIADELGITRSAVHKNIKSLRALGLTIESRQSFGYKLIDDLNFIDSSLMEKKFKRHLLGRNIVHLKSVSSTNDEAYQLAESGLDEGTVVISDTQTAGKGRMGRTWESSEANNLYFSVVLRPKILPADAPKVTVMSALAIAGAIEDETGLEPKIKWPNDILINGKKVCGILIEMKSESDLIDFMVVGIGVNVNSVKRDFPKKLMGRFTTLKAETKEVLSRQAVLERIIINLEKWYKTLLSGKKDELKKEWRRRSYLMGRSITVKNVNEELVGIARGIDENGFLLLETNGKTKRIFSGTIIKVE